jgi:hypothetical protein
MNRCSDSIRPARPNVSERESAALHRQRGGSNYNVDAVRYADEPNLKFGLRRTYWVPKSNGHMGNMQNVRAQFRLRVLRDADPSPSKSKARSRRLSANINFA